MDKERLSDKRTVHLFFRILFFLSFRNFPPPAERKDFRNKMWSTQKCVHAVHVCILTTYKCQRASSFCSGLVCCYLGYRVVVLYCWRKSRPNYYNNVCDFCMRCWYRWMCVTGIATDDNTQFKKMERKKELSQKTERTKFWCVYVKDFVFAFESRNRARHFRWKQRWHLPFGPKPLQHITSIICSAFELMLTEGDSAFMQNDEYIQCLAIV